MSKDKKPEKIGSLSDLGKLGGLPRAKQPVGNQPPKSVTGSPPPKQTAPVSRFPVKVSSLNRAGRAPYNFVPLAAKVRWLTEEETPPDLDEYHKDCLSGEIDVEFVALTDFYIRGMWRWQDFQGLPEAKGDRPEQTQPFLVNGQLRLPGSSIRGMIRNLVEIFGQAPFDQLNDQQLFFRAVAATENLDLRNPTSFEPQAVAYKSRVMRQDQQKDPNGPYVRAGFLYGSRDEWEIRPAQRNLENGQQWYRYRTDEIWVRPRRVNFSVGREPWADIDTGGRHKGWAIASGPIPKKTSQWIIHEEDGNAAVVKIPDVDKLAYLENGITQDLKKKGFDYSAGSKGVPCFYVEWDDPQGNRHVSFGHTHYFRLPYRNTTGQAVPAGMRRDEFENRWDLAQAIFGRVSKRKEGAEVRGQRGRVSFEDAFLTAAQAEVYDPAVRRVVLGQPKPTTYQHYLVQYSEGVEESVHWDGDRHGQGTPVVRGHKLYWHRPGAPLVEAKDDQDNVASRMQPARSGARFRSLIRYENLRPWELGALLMALQLPDGSAHHLGMGKPLGLGSFRLEVKAVREVDRASRYRQFLAAPGRLETGAKATVAGGNPIELYQNAFAQWLLEQPQATRGALWQDPRLKELLAMLRWRGLPTDWLARTRYLEFGKVINPQTAGEFDYNEYLRTGYPGRVELQKRRPLPPATQVLEAGPAMPNDPKPEFLPPRKKR